MPREHAVRFVRTNSRNGHHALSAPLSGRAPRFATARCLSSSPASAWLPAAASHLGGRMTSRRALATVACDERSFILAAASAPPRSHHVGGFLPLIAAPYQAVGQGCCGATASAASSGLS